MRMSNGDRRELESVPAGATHGTAQRTSDRREQVRQWAVEIVSRSQARASFRVPPYRERSCSSKIIYFALYRFDADQNQWLASFNEFPMQRRSGFLNVSTA